MQLPNAEASMQSATHTSIMILKATRSSKATW